MENEKNFYIIIDFDSTFVKIEALDKLSEIALKQSEKRTDRNKGQKNYRTGNEWQDSF